MAKAFMVALVGVLPGGLLVLGAWVLARIVCERMRDLDGTQSQRLVRAVSGLRLADVRAAARRI
jgi:hypothetical protein